MESERMYKSRLKQWGLRKNYRYEEVNEIIRQQSGARSTAAGAKPPSSAVVLGARVKKGAAADGARRARAGRRVPDPIVVKTTALALGYESPDDGWIAVTQQLTPSPTGPSFRALSPRGTPPLGMLFPLTPPAEMRMSEEAGFHVQRYYDGSFGTGRWAAVRQPGWMVTNRGVVDWFNRVALARGTLSSGHTRRGFRLLQLCFNEYQEILLTEDPRLTMYTCVAIFLLREYPEVVSMLLKYIANMSRILLGHRHPLHEMWAQLERMGLQSILENARHFFECHVFEFSKHVGSDNEVLAAITVFSVRNLVLAGLMDVESAEVKLLSLPSTGDNGRIPLALAQVYGVSGEYTKALLLIEELIETTGRMRTRAAAYDSLFLISRMQGNRDKICETSERRIRFCLETFGPKNEWTCDAGSDYEGYLREIGEIDAADRVFTDFGIQVDKITEGVQELQIK
jgi:hypothetical protein